ncbi:MAG: DUF362 domain-containing protein [archaeon]|nr:DUF362 domain-containing protein [archaeon]
MTKGVSVKFNSYSATVPALLKVIKLQDELKKHQRIIIKPSLRQVYTKNTEIKLVEAVLRFCLEHKSPDTELLIAEGSDGEDTGEMFEIFGYKKLAERYSVGLVDLNESEVEEKVNSEFSRFDKIYFPKILLDSFVISLVPLADDEETEIHGSLANMLGAYPAKYYKGFLSKSKSKIRKWPLKYSIYDIIKCKVPNLAVVDASSKGVLLAGQPLEVDKQAAKLLEKDWKQVGYLRLVNEMFTIKKDNTAPKL